MKLIMMSTSMLIGSLLLLSCNSSEEKAVTKAPKLVEENVSYPADSLTMQSFVVYDENKTGIRPAIVVIPEWWGINDYSKRRARELAQLGYIAMAVDMYGNGQQADNPQLAQELSTPFYQNPAMARARVEAAINKLKAYPQTDSTKLAGIGYCFGGGVLLNSARLGIPLKGIVSFHGSLLGTPADKNLLGTDILVLHGEDDKFVPPAEVAAFKNQMDSIDATYMLISYPGATHAFTNPDATATGQKFNIPVAYNAAADTASWNEMKKFFGKLFK